MAIYEIKKLAYIILYQLLSAKITVFLGVNSVRPPRTGGRNDKSIIDWLIWL